MFVLRMYPLKSSIEKTLNTSETAQQPEIVLAASVKVSPSKISIPALNIDLPVASGAISADTWTLYEDKASWLSTSETPGDGNVIIYAHNRKGLFGSLANITPGDKVLVDHEGNTFNYEVTEKRKVVPSDVDAILSENDQLTLYTCDGSFDQKRLIVKAKRISSASALNN